MSSGPYRLPSGGLIDRSQVVKFAFDGRALTGFAGDTLASALLANQVRVISRSTKFHRPRGVFSCGIEEPNALVQLGEGATAVPSARATVTSLVEGLSAKAQAGWPSVRIDVMRVLDAVAPLFAAGFYNKTFMWPTWHWFEPAIRRLAGLGRSPILPDPDRYEVRNAHCDVLVVGGGVAGLSAALGAARRGLRVWLVEQDEELGGYGRWCPTQIEGQSAGDWIRAIKNALSGFENARILTHTTAVGSYDHGVMTLSESCRSNEAARERFWILRTHRVVLATGALEQPLIFDHNDRPGIMLAGAAHRYLKCHAIAPGHRVLVATNNDSAYAVAHDLVSASVRVVAIVDSRAHVSNPIAMELREAGIPVHLETLPFTTSGSQVLRAVTLGKITGDPQHIQPFSNVACDALLVSGGWSPSLQLYAQAGGKLAFSEDIRALLPATPLAAITIVGAAALTAEINTAIEHAAQCGAGNAPSNIHGETVPSAPGGIGPRVSPAGNRWRQWVDLLHDVTVGDLKLAVQENYRSIEHVKRYTTLGMSVDQGKTSSVPAIEIVAELQNMTPAALGHTTMRPPVTPVTLGAIAGEARGKLFAPWRETPLHAWHAAHGGLLEQYGEWQRAACYKQPGEDREAAIHREARLVRTVAGLFDAAPLGKIEIQGPDAREFLDRFYINRLDTLRPGRVRYGIMLRESGVIFDDGTIAVLDPTHLLITTTSGNAARVASWLEEWRQCEWPSLRVVITPVTEQWATISLSGPKARQILPKLRPSCDLRPDAFPHLAMRTANLLGVPARIYRVSFSGELTYEINVPANAALRIWEALLAEGRSDGLDVYGVEALLHLRLEKGFLHVGTDTDGTTVPDDIGWGAVASAKSGDFIGKRSLSLAENVRPDRLQLVGLKGIGGEALTVGAHVRTADSQMPTDGWITSAGQLTSDGSWIALALIRRGQSRLNEIVTVHDGGRQRTSATIVTPPFYDLSGERLNG